ncbi:hypothetical protein [Leptospira meyeri]|nr:hypothetical protein [Leptospira meyeri]MCW7489181.1 hypothetical protein [Leptospira meyeri]
MNSLFVVVSEAITVKSFYKGGNRQEFIWSQLFTFCSLNQSVSDANL